MCLNRIFMRYFSCFYFINFEEKLYLNNFTLPFRYLLYFYYIENGLDWSKRLINKMFNYKSTPFYIISFIIKIQFLRIDKIG